MNRLEIVLESLKELPLADQREILIMAIRNLAEHAEHGGVLDAEDFVTFLKASI